MEQDGSLSLRRHFLEGAGWEQALEDPEISRWGGRPGGGNSRKVGSLVGPDGTLAGDYESYQGAEGTQVGAPRQAPGSPGGGLFIP